jgi:hypothetical protein
VAVRAVRANRLAPLAHQHIAELLLAAVADQHAGDGRLHVAAHRLAVDPRSLGDATLPLAPHLQPENLPDLVHTDLPEAHRHCLCR